MVALFYFSALSFTQALRALLHCKLNSWELLACELLSADVFYTNYAPARY